MRVQGIEVKGELKVTNARVYGIEESLLANAYPMMTTTFDMDNEFPVTFYDEDGYLDIKVKDDVMRRGAHLGKAKPGSGHDCYLKGVTLQFDLQAPEYIWRQLDRYHFIDYISSQSKMHRITKHNVDELCNKFVTWETIDQLNEMIDLYNSFEELGEQFIKENDIVLRNDEVLPLTKPNLFRLIIANTPCGFMLTARMTTNYLQLKSMILQRETHKMPEWIYLTDWFKSLPLVKEIVIPKVVKQPTFSKAELAYLEMLLNNKPELKEELNKK